MASLTPTSPFTVIITKPNGDVEDEHIKIEPYTEAELKKLQAFDSKMGYVIEREFIAGELARLYVRIESIAGIKAWIDTVTDWPEKDKERWQDNVTITIPKRLKVTRHVLDPLKSSRLKPTVYIK